MLDFYVRNSKSSKTTGRDITSSLLAFGSLLFLLYYWNETLFEVVFAVWTSLPRAIIISIFVLVIFRGQQRVWHEKRTAPWNFALFSTAYIRRDVGQHETNPHSFMDLFSPYDWRSKTFQLFFIFCVPVFACRHCLFACSFVFEPKPLLFHR